MTIAFLSYSLRDGTLGPGVLEQVAHELQGAHEFVYVDLLHNDDAHPQAHLEHVLRGATTLFALHTPAFQSSPWVQRELSLAQRLGLVITPVRWTT